jgi:hypothetical protein
VCSRCGIVDSDGRTGDAGAEQQHAPRHGQFAADDRYPFYAFAGSLKRTITCTRNGAAIGAGLRGDFG